MVNKQYNPDVVTHPGEILIETMRERKMRQAGLSRITGFSTKHINQVIKGKVGIGPKFAIALESALGIPASFWLRYQANYAEAKARSKGESK